MKYFYYKTKAFLLGLILKPLQHYRVKKLNLRVVDYSIAGPTEDLTFSIIANVRGTDMHIRRYMTVAACLFDSSPEGQLRIVKQEIFNGLNQYLAQEWLKENSSDRVKLREYMKTVEYNEANTSFNLVTKLAKYA